MDEEEKEKIRDIVDDINKDVKQPPYDNSSTSQYTKEYKEYKEAEVEKREKTRYEKLCIRSANILSVKAGESIHEKLTSPLKLLGWRISPGMVTSATVLVGLFTVGLWLLFFLANSFLGIFPTPLVLIFLSFPVIATSYTFYKPVIEAKRKLIKSSEEMILSILYMVIYLRSSPNLEGAVRFAALNLDGPISKDLKSILWDVEVGNYDRIDNALEDYMKIWKDYNKDYLEALELLKASINEPNPERREKILKQSIDGILDGTKEKMKHYAQSLKMPVMILNAMGAMLPVLTMIMLPMISLFMGNIIKSWYLFLIFNILLPLFLYWFMQKIFSSRPPNVNFQPSSEDLMPERGKISKNLFGKTFRFSVWPIGLVIFLLISSYGILGYLIFPEVFPVEVENYARVPGIFVSGESLNTLLMLLRSLSITSGLGIALGIVLILGNKERNEFESRIARIEKQLPSALFELGNNVSGGEPMELALKDASRATSDLEISGLFRKASKNVQQMGMNFNDSFFDEKYGALKSFPSQMLETVMRAIIESSEKGNETASMAMITISRYLENIHKTNENLKDLLEETTTTIQMLSYLLAPVISAVAVGMSQTIINAMFRLSTSFSDALDQDISGGQLAGGPGSDFGGILGNIDVAISPEILQFVVGIYLVQLLWILGTFYIKITEGDNITKQRIFVGRTLIIGTVIYTVTMLIVSALFGGILSGIGV